MVKYRIPEEVHLCVCGLTSGKCICNDVQEMYFGKVNKRSVFELLWLVKQVFRVLFRIYLDNFAYCETGFEFVQTMYAATAEATRKLDNGEEILYDVHKVAWQYHKVPQA